MICSDSSLIHFSLPGYNTRQEKGKRDHGQKEEPLLLTETGEAGAEETALAWRAVAQAGLPLAALDLLGRHGLVRGLHRRLVLVLLLVHFRLGWMVVWWW